MTHRSDNPGVINIDVLVSGSIVHKLIPINEHRYQITCIQNNQLTWSRTMSKNEAFDMWNSLKQEHKHV